MARFSPSDAAFSGFRLVRERPGAVLAWVGALTLLTLFAWVLVYMLAWAPFLELQSLQASGVSDPKTMMSLWGEMTPAWLSSGVLGLFVNTAVFAAVFRAFLDPQPQPRGGLRFGADEWRLLGVLVLYVLIYLGAHILLMAIVFLTLFFARLATLQAHAGAPLVQVLGIVAVLAMIGVLAFLAVRLSLSFVATFAEKRIGLARSWRLTRGHVWALLGAYVLTVVLAIIVYLLAYVLLGVLLAAVLLASHGRLADLWTLMRFPWARSPLLFLVVWLIGRLALNGLHAVLMAVMVGPSVEAYRAFSPTADVATP